MPAFTLYVDHQYASPYAMSVYVALTELGVPFEIRTLNLSAHEHHAAGYAAQSLTRRVPMLVADGAWNLTESSAITEYLQDTHPQARLYPCEPRARAQARQVQAWLRSDLLPIRQERPTDVIFYPPQTQPALSANAHAAASKLFAAARHWLADGREHLFDQWSVADTDLALMIQRLNLAGDAVPPVLQAYAARQWQRASVKAWCALPRP